jgi:hypothetical protein
MQEKEEKKDEQPDNKQKRKQKQKQYPNRTLVTISRLDADMDKTLVIRLDEKLWAAEISAL